MYINDIHIISYVLVGILGLVVGQFVDWCNQRLPEYKKVFSKDFFKVYLKETKPKYLLMLIVAVLYIGTLYFNGLNIEFVKYIILIPMLVSAFMIDLKLQIIPNRLTLTIFEVGLVFMFISGLANMNIGISVFIDNLLGMIVGGGIFLLITLIGGLIAGKEAMGFGDVKLMGALGLIIGWQKIIIVSVLAFLLAAIVSIVILLSKKKKANEYIPFGPFIVLSTMLTIFVPTDVLINVLLKIFTLGMY